MSGSTSPGNVLLEMQGDQDPKRAERVMAAMLQMKKLDLETLRHAYDNA